MRYTGRTQLPGQATGALQPFARVQFHYSTMVPNDRWGLGYSAAGASHTQRWRLSGITSCAANQNNCALTNQVRHYVLNYQTSVSGSFQAQLASIQECRDSSKSVCAAPTTFEWSTGRHEFSTIERPASPTLANNHIRGFKLGDFNGDGRQEVAFQWLH